MDQEITLELLPATGWILALILERKNKNIQGRYRSALITSTGEGIPFMLNLRPAMGIGKDLLARLAYSHLFPLLFIK